ncbi:mCpol domain-containing protein [Desulfobulbus sp. N2]|nr:mCpol domain-containing protein [Desulfobulbus sp. US4]MCW5205069.1 mCpol domain-containing protein [Desulfobulbus sp. N2]
MLYAFFDGDNIGTTIEILLTESKTNEAIMLSENIKTVMIEIENFLETIEYVEVLISGGDDLLIHFEKIEDSDELIDIIRRMFYSKTGTSMSCGVGTDVPQSIWNLHLAKLYGKNLVRGME